MATEKNLLIIAKLSDGKTSTITLPEAINNDLTDDSGDSYVETSYPKIAAAFATDDGATIESATFRRVVKTTTDVVVDYDNVG